MSVKFFVLVSSHVIEKQEINFTRGGGMDAMLHIYTCLELASSPGHAQILSHSHGERSGEGLGTLLYHRPEMADSVSMNLVHITY